jgi:hypothetical protein
MCKCARWNVKRTTNNLAYLNFVIASFLLEHTVLQLLQDSATTGYIRSQPILPTVWPLLMTFTSSDAKGTRKGSPTGATMRNFCGLQYVHPH